MLVIIIIIVIIVVTIVIHITLIIVLVRRESANIWRKTKVVLVKAVS